MKQLIVFLFSAVSLTNCTQNTQNLKHETDPELTITFEEKNFRSEENIYDEDTIFSEMSYRYPLFAGGDEKVTKRLNDYIFSLNQEEYFSESTDEKSAAESLEEIAKRFFAEAKAGAVEGYPYTSAWSYELTTDTVFLDTDSKKLTLIHNYYIYTGGAHPNYYISLSNIDLTTGDTVSNELLFKHDKLLLEAAKKRFIENEKLVAGENEYTFELNNYWFENDTFHLPTAIGFTREGIRCIYSPYEIASYARGAIDFLVPYSDVPHLKPRKKP